jgi:hypothetical protein
MQLDIGYAWEIEDLNVVPRLQSGGRVVLVIPEAIASYLQRDLSISEVESLNYYIRERVL